MHTSSVDGNWKLSAQMAIQSANDDIKVLSSIVKISSIYAQIIVNVSPIDSTRAQMTILSANDDTKGK